MQVELESRGRNQRQPLVEAAVESWARLGQGAGEAGRRQHRHREVDVARANEDVQVDERAQRRVGVVQVSHSAALEDPGLDALTIQQFDHGEQFSLQRHDAHLHVPVQGSGLAVPVPGSRVARRWSWQP